MKSFKDKSEKAAFWIGKYFKVINYEVKSGNYYEASEKLRWLRNKIENIFRSNTQKAIEILILENYEKKELPDFSKIKSSEIKIIRKPEFHEGKIPVIKSELIYDFSDDKFYDAFINGIYEVYHTSLNKKDEIGRQVLHILMNLFISLNNSFEEYQKYDINLFLKSYLIRKILNKNRTILSQGKITGSNITYNTGISIWLDFLRKKELQPSFVPILTESIYDSLRDSLGYDKVDFFKWFVNRLIDGGFSASSSLFEGSRIWIEVQRIKPKFNVSDQERIEAILKNINQNVGKDILLNIDAYYSRVQNLDEIVEIVSRYNSLSEEFSGCIKDTKDYYRYLFTECQITLLVLKIQVYLIFSEKFDLVYYLHEYNQPSDSDATFTNREPFPVYLHEILLWINHERHIEMQIFESGFEGHHGIKPYLKLMWIVSIVYSYRNQWKSYASQEQMISSFVNTLSLREDFSSSISFFEDLDFRFKNVVAKNKLFKKFDAGILDGVSQIFEGLINRIKEREAKVRKGARLNITLLENLVTDTIDVYKSKRFYSKHLESTTISKKSKVDFTVGVNEFYDREYFTHEFNEPINGLKEKFASEIYELEDDLIGDLIRNRLKYEGSIRFRELRKLLEKYCNEETLVIVHNLDFSSLPHFPGPDFKFDFKNNHDYYGGEFKGVKIYSISKFSQSFISFIDKSRIGSIANVKTTSIEKDGFNYIDDIFYKIVDFRTDEVELERFLEKAPQMPVNKIFSLDNPRGFLREKIWLRIFKRFRYVNRYKNIGRFYRVDVD